MISVIIPAYNAARTIKDTLTALQNQTYTAGPVEIIIVDDGSTDETAGIVAHVAEHLAEHFEIKLIQQTNAGAGAARNRGAQAAQGDLLLFTDADCIPAPDWIVAMSAPFTDPTVAGAKGVYNTSQPELTARFVQLEYEDKYDRLRQQETIDFIDTYSAAYYRDVFLQMGGFDTRYPGASVEDQEFSFRLAEAGHRLIFVPAASVAHRHDRNFIEYANRKYGIGYWKPMVMKRHPAKLARDSHTPQVLKIQMGLAGLGLLCYGLALLLRSRRWFLFGLGLWGGLIFSGLSLYRKIWQRDRSVLLVAPGLVLIRSLALGFGFFWGSIRLLQFGREAGQPGSSDL